MLCSEMTWWYNWSQPCFSEVSPKWFWYISFYKFNELTGIFLRIFASIHIRASCPVMSVFLLSWQHWPHRKSWGIWWLVLCMNLTGHEVSTLSMILGVSVTLFLDGIWIYRISKGDWPSQPAEGLQRTNKWRKAKSVPFSAFYYFIGDISSHLFWFSDHDLRHWLPHFQAFGLRIVLCIFLCLQLAEADCGVYKASKIRWVNTL